MPSPIQFAVQSATVRPAELYRVLTGEDYLRARLDELGGPNASIRELTADAEHARLVFQHGVPAEKLPSIFRRVFSGDLRIDRTETWTRESDDAYVGTVSAGMAGTPGRIEGTQRISADGAGARLLGTGKVTVSIPLIGGKVESAAAEQVNKLLAAESAFTERWLREHAVS